MRTVGLVQCPTFLSGNSQKKLSSLWNLSASQWIGSRWFDAPCSSQSTYALATVNTSDLWSVAYLAASLMLLFPPV